MNSLWYETFNKTQQFPQLSDDLSCDICIIGGGILGTTCAYYLTKQGFNVIILEKDEIASKTTGNTTAKITSQHGLFYSHLIDDYGHKFAREYLEANEKAIKNIKNIIDNEKISCDFCYQNSYVYATSPEELQSIHEEVSAVRSLNFPCEFAPKVGLPFETLGSICFKNQAQFHPLKYVYGLCDAISDKAQIFTHTTVTDIHHDTENYVVSCSPPSGYNSDMNFKTDIKTSATEYQIRAKHVILASHYPFINIPGFYFTKMYQSASYLIAVDTKKSLFSGIYLSAASPTFSFRTAKFGNKNLLLIGGSDHKTGNYCNDASTYDVLENVAKTYYPDCEVLYRWNTRDCIFLDKIPYVGLYSSNMPNLYVGTGFKKWGMTLSNISANIIVDMINGRENEYSSLFSSTRLHPIKNGDEFKNMMVQSTKSLFVDKVKKSHLEFDDIALNSGGIIEVNGDKVGIYKDLSGEIFAVKPICTHLGCLLSWNDVDKTWDCPCHGSRFDFSGKNLYEPAFKDLEKYDV